MTSRPTRPTRHIHVRYGGVRARRDAPDTASGAVPDGPPDEYRGGPVEFDRAVPPSGKMEALDKQFWLGTPRAGVVVTFWSLSLAHGELTGRMASGI
jgi:hypothetical protein